MTNPGEPTDYRFLLANERTYLAYVRTALALQVAGLGVLQFLTHAHSGVRYVVGLALVLVGSYLGLRGFERYRANERAIRAGAELPAATATLALTAVVVAVPLLGAVVLVIVALA